jgi:hypothetical protein
MTRDTWECQFTRQLQQRLGLEPEEIRFHCRGYYNHRYSVEEAIAHLTQTHELYPQLGFCRKKQRIKMELSNVREQQDNQFKTTA